jgi:hypothetical protein
MSHREPHVGDADVEEARVRLPGRIELVTEQPVAVSGDRRQ